MVLPSPGAMFWAAVSAFQRVFCSRAGNVVSSSLGRVSEETLATFSALLCGFLWLLAMSFLALLEALGTFPALLRDFSVLH